MNLLFCPKCARRSFRWSFDPAPHAPVIWSCAMCAYQAVEDEGLASTCTACRGKRICFHDDRKKFWFCTRCKTQTTYTAAETIALAIPVESEGPFQLNYERPGPPRETRLQAIGKLYRDFAAYFGTLWLIALFMIFANGARLSSNAIGLFIALSAVAALANYVRRVHYRRKQIFSSTLR